MYYYLIAGETSGDLHGANLIRELKRQDTEASFRIVGGDGMQRESGEQAVLHTSQMSFMGFVEVVAFGAIYNGSGSCRRANEFVFIKQGFTVSIYTDTYGYPVKLPHIFLILRCSVSTRSGTKKEGPSS